MNNKQIAQALREAENNFKTTVMGRIEYHKSMEELAMKKKNIGAAAYHALRRQIHQQIIDRHTLSNYTSK